MLIVIITLLSLIWLSVAVTVLAVCHMAAVSDEGVEGERASAQSPRRPTTCGTVRSKILRSPHSDQLATYR